MIITPPIITCVMPNNLEVRTELTTQKYKVWVCPFPSANGLNHLNSSIRYWKSRLWTQHFHTQAPVRGVFNIWISDRARFFVAVDRVYFIVIVWALQWWLGVNILRLLSWHLSTNVPAASCLTSVEVLLSQDGEEPWKTFLKKFLLSIILCHIVKSCPGNKVPQS